MSDSSFSSSVRGEIVASFARLEELRLQKANLKDLGLAKLLAFEVAEIEHHVASLQALVSSESAMREMWSNGAKPRKPSWLKFKEERAKKNEEPSSSIDDELDEIKGLESRNHAHKESQR